MERLVVLVFLLQAATAMLIPEDTEMLDGFGYVSFPELDDDYFEARSLSAGPLFNSVRNKRAIEYDVKESDGLISHFRPNTVNGYVPRTERSIRKFIKWLRHKNEESEESSSHGRRKREIPSFPSRKRRDVENEKKSKTTSPKETVDKSNVYSERLPTAMKLSKSSDGMTSMSRDSPVAAALVGKFPRSPFEYSKIHHEEDSMAMDTSSLSVNEGIKSRTPRVNFVTQQKKSLDHDDTKASGTKSEFYKTPPLLHNSKESTAASENERYPERSSTTRPSSFPDYKNRDPNSNHYDDRYIEDMYPPPPPPPPQPPTDTYDPIPMDYNAPYGDFYMRRLPYSGYNGHYPGSRYDIPDYRDYPPVYDNEIDNRYYMRTDMMPPPSSTLPRKRTIYYAYLPEVVRSPPTVGYRYRSYDRYDPYYPDYYNNYDANMVSNAYRRPPEKPYKYDHRTSRPMKNDDNDDITRNSSSFKEKRFNHERSYDDNKLPVHNYLHRRPSEYDSFYY